MVGDTLCDRELASLSSLSRNNLSLISPRFGGKQLHSKLNVGWHQTPTIILFPNTVIISTATVSKTTQDPSSARLVLLFHHCPRAWTGSLAPLYRTYSKILNPATGFVFGLHSRYALGRSNSSSKAPATFSFLFFFFAWRIFISITLSQSPGLLEVSTVQFIESAEQQNVVLESCSDPLCKSMGLE